MVDGSADNYTIDEATHKSTNGTTENRDNTQGHNIINKHYWWKDKDTGNVTYNGAKEEVEEWYFNSTTTPTKKASNDTITGANVYYISHNMEFLDIDHNSTEIHN